MTYDATEKSRHEGSPVELYRFAYGATTYRFTSGATEQEYLSEAYEPAVISRDQITQSQEDNAGNIQVTVPRDSPVAVHFIPYIPSQPIALTIYRRHRLDGVLETVIAFVGKILSARYESAGSRWVLTCGPITQALRKTIPAVLYQPQCNRALYSPACGANKEAMKRTITVDAVDGDTVTSDDLDSTETPSGWFNNGWAQKLHDPNDKRWIINHVGNDLTLMNPFTDLNVNDVLEVFPGCQRTEEVCHFKFGVLHNHLGFPRIPDKNPFDSAIDY